MASDQDIPRNVTREISASAARIFELIADPVSQPLWDFNDNLGTAIEGQRIRAVGDVFLMRLTTGSIRKNPVVEFEEVRRIAWKPSELGQDQPGHLWRWKLESLGPELARVTQSYDCTRLRESEPVRMRRARWTTAGRLQASTERLAALATPVQQDSPE